MNSSLKRGLFIVTLTGMISFSGEKAEASEEASQMSLPGVGIEAVLDDCLASGLVTEADSSLVSGTMGEYSDMAFTDVGADTFLFVRSEPTTQSDWVGKLYRDDAAKIKGPVGEWTKIESGSVTGYVYTDYIIIGKDAQQKAQELIQASGSPDGESAFTYAVSRQEEKSVSPGRRRSRLRRPGKQRSRRAAQVNSRRRPPRRQGPDRPSWSMPASLSATPTSGAGQA